MNRTQIEYFPKDRDGSRKADDSAMELVSDRFEGFQSKSLDSHVNKNGGRLNG